MSVWTDKRTRYEFGDFILEGGRRRLLRRGSDEPQALTAKSFDTLFYLIEHRGETVDKDTLLRTLWPGVIVEENSLTQVISSLRQVLGEAPGENRYIATVPRKGYRFVGEVTEPTALAGPEVTPTMAGPVAADARRSRRPIWLGAAALSVVVSVTGAFLLQRSRGGHSSPSATSAPPAIRTLAVLPFKPLLPTERDESLELGMTESMIARLGAHDGMTVRP
jgi:DNA-binding winged helix-turn-helix (wHTH) protein